MKLKFIFGVILNVLLFKSTCTHTHTLSLRRSHSLPFCFDSFTFSFIYNKIPLLPPKMRRRIDRFGASEWRQRIHINRFVYAENTVIFVCIMMRFDAICWRSIISFLRQFFAYYFYYDYYYIFFFMLVFFFVWHDDFFFKSLVLYFMRTCRVWILFT